MESFLYEILNAPDETDLIGLSESNLRKYNKKKERFNDSRFALKTTER